MTIHIKPPYAPQREINLAEANQLLQRGELSLETMAWIPGMSEWVPLKDIPGISSPTPPSLLRTAQTTSQPEKHEKKPKKKVSIKAIISLILVILGFMMMAGGTGFGIILFLAGIILGWFASRDFKKRPEEVGGKGVLTAVRVLIMIFCLMIGIGLIAVIVPSCNSATDKGKQSAEVRAEKYSAQSKTKRVYGEILKYSFDVGAEWKPFYSQKPFDLALQNTPIFVCVIAEDESMGSPEAIAKHAREELKRKSEVLEMTDPIEIEMDGKPWLAFESKAGKKDKNFSSLFRVYSGPEGTFQVVGFTSNEMTSDQRKQIEEVMDTFRFPQQ